MHGVVMAALRAGNQPGSDGHAVLKNLLDTISETVLPALLKEVATGKQLQSALTVFRMCKNKSTPLYTAALDCCIDARNADEIDQVMSECIQAELADINTYNLVVKAHSQGKRPDKAKALVDQMKKAGLTPNGATF